MAVRLSESSSETKMVKVRETLVLKMTLKLIVAAILDDGVQVQGF